MKKFRNCLKINLKMFFYYLLIQLWLCFSKNSGLFEKNKGANRQKKWETIR